MCSEQEYKQYQLKLQQQPMAPPGAIPDNHGSYFGGARKQLHLGSQPTGAPPSDRQASHHSNYTSSHHSAHSSSHTSHHIRSLPTSPLQELPPAGYPQNSLAEAGQLYNAGSYQDRSQQPRLDSATSNINEVLARKLEGDFQQALRQKTESPISLSSGSSQPGQLDFTVGSKDSLDNEDNNLDNLGQDAELDISLEHETRSVGSVGSAGHMDTQLAMQPPRHNLSNPDLTHAHRQPRQPTKAAPVAQDASRFRSRSVENLTPRKSYKQWNMVDIDIDNPGGVTGRSQQSQSGARTTRQDTAKGTRELAPPINSSRLRPIRQKTRNAVVSRLKHGFSIKWLCHKCTYFNYHRS